jgi:uncharacterized oligopeptide transporter (OPT) family protein
MSGGKQLLSRRPVLAGLAATTAAALAGIVADLVASAHRRVSGPYAALVNQLDNPQAAKVIGSVILAKTANAAAAIREAHAFASERLAKQRLANAIATDVEQGFLTEADGWVIPITLGALSVLASQSD